MLKKFFRKKKKEGEIKMMDERKKGWKVGYEGEEWTFIELLKKRGDLGRKLKNSRRENI